MKQGKCGDSVKSVTAFGFPTNSRSKGKVEDTGEIVPVLAQPLTAVEPLTSQHQVPHLKCFKTAGREQTHTHTEGRPRRTR